MGWDEEWLTEVSRQSGGAMTATEVRARLAAAEEAAEKAAYKRTADAYRKAFIAEFAPAASSPEYPPITFSAIGGAHSIIRRANYEPKDFSIVIPARDFCQLLDDARLVSFRVSGDSAGTSAMRVYDIEILRGDRDVVVYAARRTQMIKSNFEALEAEILRCLGRGAVGELPQSASGNGVSPRVKPVSEVGVTSSAAGRDNRDSNRPADLSHEEKVIAAKHAIAVYARDKKLPSAEMLATFGELDRAKASGGAAAVGVDIAKPGADKSVRWWAFKKAVRGPVALPASDELLHGYGGLECDFVVFDEAADFDISTRRWHGVKWVQATPANINRHAHRLSSESLGRAADQIWGAHSGGSYADLVCSRAERLAEMACRGDSATDGEWG